MGLEQQIIQIENIQQIQILIQVSENTNNKLILNRFLLQQIQFCQNINKFKSIDQNHQKEQPKNIQKHILLEIITQYPSIFKNIIKIFIQKLLNILMILYNNNHFSLKLASINFQL
ncbi:hypothetical protein pb186bvf_017279 [Paramecium bursaria]